MGSMRSTSWHRSMKGMGSPYGNMCDGVYNQKRDLPEDRIVTLPEDYVPKQQHKEIPQADLFPILDKLNVSDDFCLGNVVKYISRSRGRNHLKEKSDLKKALVYLQRKIEML